MKNRLFVQIATSLAVGTFFIHSAAAQDIQDQINQQKADWGGTQQRDYLLGNSAPAPAAVPAAPAPMQQMQLQMVSALAVVVVALAVVSGADLLHLRCSPDLDHARARAQHDPVLAHAPPQ